MMGKADMSSSNNAQTLATDAPARPNLVEAAKSLAPLLRERAEETKQLRRLPDTTWQDLMEAGILRGLQPARWGGVEAHPGEFYGAAMEVARAEGCAGWIAGLIGAHPWQLAVFPKEAQAEFWGENPKTTFSSSYIPTGKAERVPGGFGLQGRWSFSSGCDHCQWVMLGAMLDTVEFDGRQVPDFRSFLLPRKDYRIDDNWHVAGLAGTGSKDIVVEGAFVPEYRTQSHWDYARDQPLPGWDINPGPLYRLPFGAVFIGTLAGAVLGAAEGFLDTWIEVTRNRVSLGQKLSEDPLTQELVSKASYTIKTVKMRFLQEWGDLMQAAQRGNSLSLAERAELRYSTTRAAQLASRVVDRLFEASGGHAIFFNHPLQTRYQDIKAMMGHLGLSPNLPIRLYGAALLGLPVSMPIGVGI
jgi:3-hydroxy-9,10-secoandrosta-1,3,5(10)-triene-9,17-dione monooxygenase